MRARRRKSVSRQGNNQFGILGLCMRAGKLVTGAQGAEKAIKSGEGVLALFDASASDGTKKAIRDACAYARVEWLQLPAGVLSRETGKSGRMAAAVTDASFARGILRAVQEASKQYD